MKNVLKIKYIACCAVLACSLVHSSAFATRNEVMESKGSLYTGFRLIDSDTFQGIGEYEEEESSLILGGEFENYPFPHRYHIDGEISGENDYYLDFGYALSDIVLFKNNVTGLHHNLDHYSYQYRDDFTTKYVDRNPGDDNYVDFVKNDMYLRLKTPNFPFHAFMRHRYVAREGAIQERYLLGYHGNRNKVGQSREIDWTFNDLTLGLNSHLGPIEAEYAYNQTDFDGGDNSVLYDFDPVGRPPGVFPHMSISDTESYGNSLKLHTSYTGQLVAAASLSNDTAENNYSQAESDTLKGSFDLQWIPDPIFGMFFRYRHVNRDKETPEYTTVTSSRASATLEVRPPVSYENNILSVAARYRLSDKTTLNGGYEYEVRTREEHDEWHLIPEESKVHKIDLKVRTTVMDNVKLKGSYDYHVYENPSYNNDPDNSHSLKLNADFSPADWINASLDYSVTLTEREDMVYPEGNGLQEIGTRDGRTDRAYAGMSFVLTPETSLAASWSYSRWETKQDVAYTMWVSATSSDTVLYFDHGAPYTDQANVVALNLFTRFREDMGLSVGLSHTWMESEYLPTPSYMTVYNTQEITETVASAEITKMLNANWEVALLVKAGVFEEEFNQDNLDEQDGELYLSTLTFKRYF